MHFNAINLSILTSMASVISVAKLLSGKKLLATEGTEITDLIPIHQTGILKREIKGISQTRPGMEFKTINPFILISVPSVNSVAKLLSGKKELLVTEDTETTEGKTGGLPTNFPTSVYSVNSVAKLFSVLTVNSVEKPFSVPTVNSVAKIFSVPAAKRAGKAWKPTGIWTKLHIIE